MNLIRRTYLTVYGVLDLGAQRANMCYKLFGIEIEQPRVEMLDRISGAWILFICKPPRASVAGNCSTQPQNKDT